MVNLEQALNTGSIMLTLYAIAVVLIYMAFIRPESKPKRK